MQLSIINVSFVLQQLNSANVFLVRRPAGNEGRLPEAGRRPAARCRAAVFWFGMFFKQTQED